MGSQLPRRQLQRGQKENDRPLCLATRTESKGWPEAAGNASCETQIEERVCAAADGVGRMGLGSQRAPPLSWVCFLPQT